MEARAPRRSEGEGAAVAMPGGPTKGAVRPAIAAECDDVAGPERRRWPLGSRADRDNAGGAKPFGVSWPSVLLIYLSKYGGSGRKPVWSP